MLKDINTIKIKDAKYKRSEPCKDRLCRRLLRSSRDKPLKEKSSSVDLTPPQNIIIQIQYQSFNLNIKIAFHCTCDHQMEEKGPLWELKSRSFWNYIRVYKYELPTSFVRQWKWERKQVFCSPSIGGRVKESNSAAIFKLYKLSPTVQRA